MRLKGERLAIATAFLWFWFVTVAPAAAGPVLETPTGLSPGDHFRFVFVTDGTTTATSSNITDYDNFVNTQAQGATYGGAVVSWLAIGSTDAVNAIDHVGPTNTGVYLVDGTMVTSSTTLTGLWSGSITHAISEDVNGVTPIPGPDGPAVWTGTNIDGIGVRFNTLGNDVTAVVEAGDYFLANAGWVTLGTFANFSGERVYAISDVLTAVPEPTALVMGGTALLGGLACHCFRQRRTRRKRTAGQGQASE